MKYLHDKSYYEDLYDLHTIEHCLDHVKMVQDVNEKIKLEEKIKKYPEEELERNRKLFLNRLLFVVKAERFKKRADTISEWMSRDRAKQEKQDKTLAPLVDCPDCTTSMVADDFRHLDDWPEEKPMRVLFIFNCPKCKKRLGVYDNGDIYESKPDLCPKCNKEMSVKATNEGKIITTLYKCKQCGYSNKDILDLSKRDEEHRQWEEEQKKKDERDKMLLDKYREDFCLSETEGKEYVETLEAMEVAHEVKQEVLAEMNTPAHEKLVSVNKISITDLEALVNKALEDSGFTRLSLGNPDMDRYVLVPFTVQEAKPKRRDLESVSDLHDILKNVLKDTNWRAPKDMISYRLGFLTGKLKGYELEDDLLKLFGKQEPKKPNSKLNPGMRAKYEHHNLVQLARMDAEYIATKRNRTRRLKNEPDGFYLNDGGRGYTCGICGRSHNGEDIWWRPDGLRCRDCWRNIKEGVIPVLDLDKEHWEEEDFIESWQIKSEYGVHPSTAGKLRKEGVLVAKDLKDSNGNVYCTIYLVSENKEFLKKYPKKPDKYKITFAENKKGLVIAPNIDK